MSSNGEALRPSSSVEDKSPIEIRVEGEVNWIGCGISVLLKIYPEMQKTRCTVSSTSGFKPLFVCQFLLVERDSTRNIIELQVTPEKSYHALSVTRLPPEVK